MREAMLILGFNRTVTLTMIDSDSVAMDSYVENT